MNNASLINQDSGDYEYYTPLSIVDAARQVMGGIDLDPASSLKANEKIGAVSIFTVSDDGLLREWHGRIWMNHPFSRDNNRAWIAKLVNEYWTNRISQACCITYAATSEQWFQPLLKFPQCFLSPRTNYIMPDGTLKRGVTKGSVVTYLGPRTNEFAAIFKPFGVCK